MFRINSAQPRYFKMDILFFNSIQMAKSTYSTRITINLLKFVLLTIFLVIDTYVLKSQQTQLLNFMKFGIAISIVNAIINILIRHTAYNNNQINNSFFLNLAQAATHASLQQRIQNPNDIYNIQNCVSPTLYNANTGSLNNDPGLTEQIRFKYEDIIKNLIHSQVLQKHKNLSCADLIGKILSLAGIVYAIIAIAKGHSNGYQIAVIVIYVFLQFLNVWVVIIILLAIVFSPLICCIGCIYVICKGGTGLVDRDSLNIPQPLAATAKIIEQSDGTCSICLQNFALNDKVIRLNCSPKHTFHQNCIMSWLRVSNSCPMCRAPLSQAI